MLKVMRQALIIRVIFCGDHNNSAVTVSMISVMSHKKRVFLMVT